MRKGLIVLPVALAFAATTVIAGPAAAESTGLEAAVYVQLAAQVNGVWTPVSVALEDAAMLDFAPTVPSDPGTVTPYLIDWDQWFGCFSMNNEEDDFAEYVFWWDGVGKDVRLKCGNDYWGYKHIRAGHEADWQNKLNAARNAGWNVGPVASGGSWDDFMSEATAISILWPDYVGANPVHVTTCVVGNLGFMNTDTGQIVYEFKMTAAFANNSDRLITSYPTGSSTC